MAATVIKTQIQFRRDTTANWDQYKDVVPACGEPCFDYEAGILKIGDGVNSWENLPCTGEDCVVNAQTHYDFPSTGKPNVIYKAEAEQTIYQWNSVSLKYEQLNFGGSGGIVDINLINGGQANG